MGDRGRPVRCRGPLGGVNGLSSVTLPKVARIPHIPMLEENNVRSGVFEQEDCLALRGALPDYAKVPVILA